MAKEGTDSGLDAVVRDAANQKHENDDQQSEFDTIARYRGVAQDNMANLLAGHLHSHGDKEGTVPQTEGGASQQLHKSSEEAKDRVFQANDRTYDAIEEAKNAVKKKFEEAKQNQNQGRTGNDSDDQYGAGSYSAINQAKEMLKDKFEAEKKAGADQEAETTK